MKKLVAVLSVIALAGCAGTQQKLVDAKAKAKDLGPKIECRAKVVEPYIDFILEQDLPELLDGLKNVDYVLEVAGVLKAEADATKAAFAACGKL